jgi:hypothetical protein
VPLGQIFAIGQSVNAPKNAEDQAEREQWDDGNNVVALEPGVVVAYDRNTYTNTLLRKAGDCDDTTVLLASALESAGIRTAVLTTPGHIFLAFDTGESVPAAAVLAAPPLELLSIEGSSWIPLETRC